MDWQMRIEGYEAATLSPGHLDQVGVVHLLMTKRVQIDRRFSCLWRRPKAVLFV